MEQQEHHKRKLCSAIAGSIVKLLIIGTFAAVMIVVMLYKKDIIQGMTDWKKAQGDEKLQVKAAETEPAIIEEKPEEILDKQIENPASNEEEYATSHIEEEPAEPEEIPEPVAAFPVRLSDVYAEKGSVAVFRCYDPEATHYLWETYDPRTESWAENGEAVEITDELYRKISTLLVEADDIHSELTVRCRVSRESADDIVSTAVLHILPEIESISVPEYTAEAGTYVSAREIPVQISFQDGSKDTITGLNGLFFLKKEESSEQGTTVSGNVTETITTVYTACDYNHLENGDQEAILRYQGRNKPQDEAVMLIAEDLTPPEIKEVSIGDYEVSTTDQPVPVTVTIIAEDEITAYPELAYAFLPEGKEPKAKDWIKGTSTWEMDITQNGTWVAYCKDESGNIATQEKHLIVVDNKPPVVDVFLEYDTWCRENKIHVAATDGMSVEYSYICDQTGEDTGWSTRNEHTITDNGLWRIKVRDAVGNVTEQEIRVDNIDRQAPVIRSITSKRK